MEQLLAKIKTLLSSRFAGSYDELEGHALGGRVGGAFVWPGFDGMAQIDRQDLVRQVLREGLTREEELSVGLLLTFTPQEVAAMDEVMAAA